MVQDYASPVRIHKFPFEMVMAAYERRFPSCPQIPVVLECVVTDDSWTEDHSQRHTMRRCQLNVEAPYILKKMIGVDFVYFIQKNTLDLKSRVLVIEATNESFASRVDLLEECRYFVHPENPEWTCFEQKARLDVKNFFGLEGTVEKIAMKQYAANISKGKQLIETFMADLTAEGVEALSPWAAGEDALNYNLRKIICRGVEPLSPTQPESTKKSPTQAYQKSRIETDEGAFNQIPVWLLSSTSSRFTTADVRKELADFQQSINNLRSLVTPPEDNPTEKLEEFVEKLTNVTHCTFIFVVCGLTYCALKT